MGEGGLCAPNGRAGMMEDDWDTCQQEPDLESLRAAAHQARGKTRGFSLEQEILFAGDGRTLRARLLEQWWRLLGLSPDPGKSIPPGSAPPGPATMITDIQGHEIGCCGTYANTISPLDRVKEMEIVRGSVLDSRPTLSARLREIVLELQKTAFVRQSLPKEQEEAWSRTPLLKRRWKMVQAFFQEPPKVSLRDPGRVWKDFVSCFAPETLWYQCEIREHFDLEDPQRLADLLFATCRAMQEFAQPTVDAGQPLGYVLTSATRATTIRPYRAGDDVPVLVYHQAGNGPRGVLITIRPGQQKSILDAQIKQAMEGRANWQELGGLDHVLLAVNVTRPQRPGEGLFSQGWVRPGFRAGRRAHPWLVFYQGLDTQGNQHLQASADHFACDGRLLGLFIRGGVAGGQLFEGLAGLYQQQTGQKFLGREPRTLADLLVSDYGQVVLAEMPRPDVNTGADLFTCAALWAIGLHISHMQKTRGGIWNTLSPNAACNFTVTDRENPLKPLSVASCWLSSPEKYASDSPFYPYRHVVGLTAGLIGFKLGKELAFGRKRLPEAMYWMSLLVHNRFPGWFKKAILKLNRSWALTDIRNHLFPPTIIFEKEAGGLIHNTVAGTDLPNVVIWEDQQDNEITLSFSIAPDSRFVAPGELGPLAEWLAAAMRAFLETVGQWQQEQDGTLRELDQRIQVLYQEKSKELADRYSAEKHVATQPVEASTRPKFVVS